MRDQRLTNIPSRLGMVGQRVVSISWANKTFYKSWKWQNFIKEIVSERGRKCEKCGRENCRIFGDHIKELEDGGESLDKSNIQLLCGSCHTIKTNHEKNKRYGLV